MVKKDFITITDAARKRIQQLMLQRDKPALGIRIGVNTKGCSGLSYTLEYVDNVTLHDEQIVLENFTVFIDPKATLFILGTEMDFIEDKIQNGFVFNNPNEKGRCGCGKSFHV